MDKSDLPHVLLESEQFLEIKCPLKSSKRIKYTCFTVSQSLIIFGATSGGLYVFYREPCSFSELLPNKEGAVSHVAISQNENLIAFATLKGIIGILERNEGFGARMINRSTEHYDSRISALQWSENNCQLFAGDEEGKVSVLNIVSVSKNMFQVPAYTLMQLDSRIVQLSSQSGLLLVSTLTRCYICDTVKEQYKQVGQKLRDGEFGACFFSKDDGLKIFCARPGSRLWEVDAEGIVKSTHELKKAFAVPPAPIISLPRHPKIIIERKEGDWPSQSFNFAQLLVSQDNYLVTYNSNGIYLLKVNSNVSVLLWSNHIENVIDVKCVGDNIYVYLASGDLRALKVMSLDKCLLRLYYKNHVEICAELCILFLNQLLNWDRLVYLYHLRELESKLATIDKPSLESELKPFFEKLSTVEYNPVSQLNSGIFFVDNFHLNSQLIENQSVYSNFIKLRSRQSSKIVRKPRRSSSLPHNRRRKKLRKGKISGSLPNLVQVSKNDCDKEKPKTSKIYSSEQVLNEPSYALPFPLIGIATPDVIHDAIVELSTNVTGKLVDGTKSLHEKWQILEGKFGFLKGDVNNEVPDEPSIKNEFNSDLDKVNSVSNFDESLSIVDRPNKKKSFLPDLDTSKLLKLCEELDNLSENDLKVDLFFDFFDVTLTLFSEYQSKLKKSRTSSNFAGTYFPFSLYLSDKEVSVIQHIFHEALKSNIIIQWFQEDKSFHMDCDLKLESYPSLLENIHSENDLLCDCFVSLILSVFSEVLDASIILQCLHSSSLNCSFKSFCTILLRFQDNNFPYIVSGKEYPDSHVDWPLPVLLNNMSYFLQLDQLEVSSQMGIEGKVTLKHISYIILKLQMQLINSGIDVTDAEQKYHVLFLSYLSKLIVKSITLNLNNDTVIAFVLKSFLNVNSVPLINSCENCSFLLSGVNLTALKFAEIGYLIIDHFWNSHLKQIESCDFHTNSPNGVDSKKLIFTELAAISKFDELKDARKKNLVKLISSNVTTSLREIINICQSIPSLWKYLLSRDNIIQHIPSAVSLMIQLNLVTKSNNMLTVKNINLFEKVLILNIICKKGICLNCGFKNALINSTNYGIPWNELCCIILKCIDSKTTIEILQKYSNEIAQTALELSFYQSAILSAMVDAHHPGLRPKVINRVSCLAKGLSGIPMFSPDVASTFDGALRRDSNHDFFYQKLDESDSETHHWGVRIDLEEEFCHLCSLPLGAKALIAANNGGLIAFKCGHTYHAVCLKHQNSSAAVCTVCYST